MCIHLRTELFEETIPTTDFQRSIGKHLQSLSDEVETSEKEIDHAREDPDEIMEINHDIGSKFEKKDENMKRWSRKEDFQMLP
ncbi:hypothetical protein TNCV_4533511 [Trichonephila clavipes]|nr:hypothetical protein TNCV_4533511 [Trichonephila clavipes]